VLRKKETRPTAKAQSSLGVTAASVEEDLQLAGAVAVVLEENTRLYIEDSFIKVSLAKSDHMELAALIDTGSPVSFVKRYIFDKHLNLFCKITTVACKLRNLSNERLERA